MPKYITIACGKIVEKLRTACAYSQADCGLFSYHQQNMSKNTVYTHFCTQLSPIIIPSFLTQSLPVICKFSPLSTHTTIPTTIQINI